MGRPAGWVDGAVPVLLASLLDRPLLGALLVPVVAAMAALAAEEVKAVQPVRVGQQDRSH